MERWELAEGEKDENVVPEFKREYGRTGFGGAACNSR